LFPTVYTMKVLKVNDKRVAKRLRLRLLRRGIVVAEVNREDDLKKDFVKKAHVVLFVTSSLTFRSEGFLLQRGSCLDVGI